MSVMLILSVTGLIEDQKAWSEAVPRLSLMSFTSDEHMMLEENSLDELIRIKSWETDCSHFKFLNSLLNC